MNVTEKAARALDPMSWGYRDRHPEDADTDFPTLTHVSLRQAREALSALHQPDVQAGIAGVLHLHQQVERDNDTNTWYCPGCDADLGGADDSHPGAVSREEALAAHQAAAVVAWITRRQA